VHFSLWCTMWHYTEKKTRNRPAAVANFLEQSPSKSQTNFGSTCWRSMSMIAGTYCLTKFLHDALSPLGSMLQTLSSASMISSWHPYSHRCMEYKHRKHNKQVDIKCIFINKWNKYIDPPYCQAKMYAGHVACCPLVSMPSSITTFFLLLLRAKIAQAWFGPSACPSARPSVCPALLVPARRVSHAPAATSSSPPAAPDRPSIGVSHTRGVTLRQSYYYI